MRIKGCILVLLYSCILSLSSCTGGAAGISSVTENQIKQSVSRLQLGLSEPAGEASFKAIKGKKIRINDAYFTQVQLEYENFPPGGKYTLYTTKIDDSIACLGHAIVNARGQLLLDDIQNLRGLTPFENYRFFICGCMPGEEITYTLLSSDNATCFSTSIAEKPLAFQAIDGAAIKILMRSPNADFFYLLGKGFTPSENLELISQSCTEIMEKKITANDQGELVAGLLPAVVGCEGGEAKLKIVRQNSEILTLDYFWGTEAKNRRM